MPLDDNLGHVILICHPDLPTFNIANILCAAAQYRKAIVLYRIAYSINVTALGQVCVGAPACEGVCVGGGGRGVCDCKESGMTRGLASKGTGARCAHLKRPSDTRGLT